MLVAEEGFVPLTWRSYRHVENAAACKSLSQCDHCCRRYESAPIVLRLGRWNCGRVRGDADMPTTDPDNTNFVAGDDWCIGGTLLDRDGNPLDLMNASITWTLLDPSGAPVAANAIITVLDPPTAGLVNIKLAAATTAALAPGRYTEALRITRAGTTSTFQGLSIMVVA